MKNVELNCLKVSIPEAVLRRLLWANQLCAADLNCLDWPSKHTLRRLCLESCLGASDPVSQRRPGHTRGRSRRPASISPARCSPSGAACRPFSEQESARGSIVERLKAHVCAGFEIPVTVDRSRGRTKP